ncbi:tetrachloroethene dehalogenase [Dehalobacter restrictus]|uniref:Tetrachloroethene dehalogenase n=1 Tax=Dehalobacter restrictus (strain DSM 9455 / PER-K23) TaxID=871738 RepID=A0ABN4BSS8_DEHRP|nr:tetrachloroethene dehalogenase [Dehalobacter restrictus]AHF10433.1 tetrachloroethene dehalogenase [Dehalobacter restrictus DSM 9455]
MKIANDFVWMFFGMLMLFIQFGIWQYSKSKAKNTIPIQLCGFLTNFLFIFTLAWAYASLLEHEYQAVSMGFVFFGGATLIPGIITYRLLNRSEKKSKNNSATTSV